MKTLGQSLCDAARQAEQALEDLDELIGQAQDCAIFSVDAEGQIEDWNNGVARLLGYERHEFVGQSLWLIFTPEDVSAGQPGAELRQALERGRSIDNRWHVRKDGAQIWVHGCLVAIRDRHTGELRKLSKIMRDDTERKTLEEEVVRHRSADQRLPL